MFCSKCGAENQYGDIFCHKCGSRVDETSTASTNIHFNRKKKTEIKHPSGKTKKLSNNNVSPAKQAIIITSICIITTLIIMVIIFVINPYMKLESAINQAFNGEYNAAYKTIADLEGDEAYALRQYINLRKTLILAEKEPYATYQEDHIDEARELINTIYSYEASLDDRFLAQTKQIFWLLDTIESKYVPVKKYLTEIKALDNILSEIITEINRIRDGGSFTVAEVRSNVESWLESTSSIRESANAIYKSIECDDLESDYTNYYENDINEACDFLLERMNAAEKKGWGVDSPCYYTSIGAEWYQWDLETIVEDVKRDIRNVELDRHEPEWYNCPLHRDAEHDIEFDDFSYAENRLKNHILTGILREINSIDVSSTELVLEDGLNDGQFSYNDEIDTIPQGSNERRGNTVGNIANNGLVAQENEWIYYVGGMRDECEPGIYKIRTDGTNKSMLISCKAKYINVVDGWVYCVAIVEGIGDILYKMPTDGSEGTMLTDPSDNPLVKFSFSDVNLVDDWIYFNGSKKIYKVRTDGTEGTLLSSDAGWNINVVEDWIYYCVSDDGMYKMRTDGSEKTKLCDEYGDNVNVANEWIYYSVRDGEYSRIFKMRTDGSEKTKLSDDGHGINVLNGWIYYSNDDGFYRMRTDGTKAIKLSDKINSVIYVMDGWIYYYTDNGLNRMRVDGSDIQLLD